MTKKIKADTSTEEKIKEAARKVFTQKGYSGTRTRDIAEEAGLNLALLNYYFRSKEKLFEIVMMEKMQKLFGTLAPTLNDPTTSLESKIEKVADIYIQMLSQNPDLPIFVLSEIKNNAERFQNLIQPGKLLVESAFVKQLKERRPDIHPFHFVFNILGMMIFPFVGRPVFQSVSKNPDDFNDLMEERKKLIPIWTTAILKVK
jgi:AcrR family transcriptional regulator